MELKFEIAFRQKRNSKFNLQTELEFKITKPSDINEFNLQIETKFNLQTETNLTFR